MAHLDAFLDYLRYQKRFSPHTLRNYERDIRQFQSFLKEECGEIALPEVHHHLIRAWLLAQMEREGARSSIKRRLSALRSFYRYLLREGQVAQNPATLVQMPKASQKLVRVVAEEELEKLFAQAPFAFGEWGHTQALMLELLYGTGMRVAELVALKAADCDLIEGKITVTGKGNKQREIPLAAGLSEKIARYLRAYPRQPGQALLLTRRGKKLYPKLVYNVVNYYLSLVSGTDQKSPHVLRHSFATHMLNHGADLQAIKELLGHASLAATQVYTHSSIEKLKDMYNQAHPRSHK